MRSGWTIGLVVGVSCVSPLVSCVGDEPTVSPGGGNDASAEASSGGVGPDGGGGDASSTDSGCGDTQSSAANCGACGHACTGSNQCYAGVCGNVPIKIASSPSANDTCALFADGTIWCWGANDSGQLGDGDAAHANQNRPTQILKDVSGSAFDGVADMDVGAAHACAVKKDGTVWCWGRADFGQLGDGAAMGGPIVLAPKKVPGLAGFKWVRAGDFFTCATNAAGEVWCWGSNDSGSLGHELATDGDVACNPGSAAGCSTQPNYNSCCNSSPKKVTGVSSPASFAIGAFDACAIDGSGYRCWGKNYDFAQLGGATTSPPYSPSPVTLSVAGDTVVMGRDAHCAIKAGAPVHCWGRDDVGMLGQGGTQTYRGIVPWGGGAGVVGVSVALGFLHACVVGDTGGVTCAGAGLEGQLGSGTPASKSCTTAAANVACETSPVTVVYGGGALGGIVEAAAGRNHTCARAKDGAIYCWGDDTMGQLGNGTSGTQSNSAVKVVGLP